MFFNRNFIPAVPIREEQRLSEEEELARQLKREARIFFPDKEEPGTVLENHDSVCRQEDSMWRKSDGSFTHHEAEAARQEAQQVAKNRQQLNSKEQSTLQSADGEMSADRQTSLQMGEVRNSVRPRINKQELKRGIRLKVILDKPRGLTPWKGDNY